MAIKETYRLITIREGDRTERIPVIQAILRKTVLEPGPGMGFFTLELARLAGPLGRVIAVDVQPKMIEVLMRRAKKAGLLARIDARVVPATSMNLGDLDGAVDFVFAGFVVHEMPAAASFFAEAARAMKRGATLLLVEPAGHVSEAEFMEQRAAAAANGLKLLSRPFVESLHCRTIAKAVSAPAFEVTPADQRKLDDSSERDGFSYDSNLCFIACPDGKAVPALFGRDFCEAHS